jgi:hypothetical protein
MQYDIEDQCFLGYSCIPWRVGIEGFPGKVTRGMNI